MHSSLITDITVKSFVSRKQQKTRKIIEAVDESLLSITEDSSEQQYMDVDLAEYSTSSQPEPNSSLSELQPLVQKPTEVKPETVSPGQSVDAADKVDLPEGQ